MPNTSFENPFRPSPKRSLVFASAGHERGCQQLRSGIQQLRPLQLLYGAPGTGKTTLLRELIQRADPGTRSIFCASSALDSSQLLDLLYRALDRETAAQAGPSDLDAFLRHARRLCGPSGSLLILVDEAQYLDSTGLALILRIADQTTRGQGRFLTVMAGTGDLARRLSAVDSSTHPSLQSVTAVTLACLSAEEVRAFVAAQLRQDGLAGIELTAAAVDRVAELSHGVPRLVNSLCAHALFLAQLAGDSAVTQAHVEEASGDISIALSGSELATPVEQAETTPQAQGSPPVVAPELPQASGEPSATASDGSRVAPGGGQHLVTDHETGPGGTAERATSTSSSTEPEAAGGAGEPMAHSPAPAATAPSKTPERRPRWAALVAFLAAVAAVGAYFLIQQERPDRSADAEGGAPALADAEPPEVPVQVPSGGSAGISVSTGAGEPTAAAQPAVVYDEAPIATDVPKVAAAGSTFAAVEAPLEQSGETVAELALGDPGMDTPPAEIQVQRAAILEQDQVARQVAELGDQALAQLAAGQLEAAKASTSQALELAPEDPDLLALRSQVDAELAAAQAAAEVADQVQRRAETARARLLAADLEGARRELSAGLEHAPENAGLLALQADLDAQQQAAKAREETAAEVSRLREQALAQRAQGALEDAIASSDRALALDASDPQLVALRAELVAQNQEAQTAQQLAAEVARLKDDAEARRQAEDYVGALVDIDRALQLAPEDEDLLTLRPLVESQYQEQQERQRVAEALAGLSAQAREDLAAERYEEALAAVAKALSQSPEHAELKALQAEIETQRQAAMERQRIAEETAQLTEQARASLAAGEPERALESVKRALDLSPDDPELASLQQEIEQALSEAFERRRTQLAAARLSDDARAKLAAGDHAAALASVAEALDLVRDDSELVALQAEIESAQRQEAERQRIAAELAGLRDQARARQTEGDYPGALASVSEALLLAPGESQLLALQAELGAQQQAALERQRVTAEAAALADEARRALASGDFDAAQGGVDQALARLPDDPDLQVLRQEIEGARQEALERERIAQEVAGLAQESRRLQSEGDYPLALETLDRALALEPEEGDLLALREQLSAEHQAALERERIAQEVAGLAQESRRLQSEGAYPLALETLDRALAVSPEDGEVLAFRQEILDQQSAELERQRIALEVERSRNAARQALAVGDLEAALAHVEELSQLDPEHGAADTLRQEIEERRQAALEAEREAREAAGLREAARAALAAEDLGLAQSQVSAALQLSPADPESLALQEQIVAQQQQRAERQRISGEVARLSGAARAALAGQDYQAGLAAIEAALELSPDETELQSLREELLAQRAAAEERERVAVERARLLDQVQSYRLAGDFPQALAALEQALESSAGDPELQTLRAELEAEQDAAIAAAETARQSGATEAADARAQQLVDSGTRQLELRDFASARLFFEAAVDAGAVRAATLLARTYDPLALRELGALGVQSDPEKALHWYAVGAEAGDPEAQERMSVLRRSFSPP